MTGCSEAHFGDHFKSKARPRRHTPRATLLNAYDNLHLEGCQNDGLRKILFEAPHIFLTATVRLIRGCLLGPSSSNYSGMCRYMMASPTRWDRLWCGGLLSWTSAYVPRGCRFGPSLFDFFERAIAEDHSLQHIFFDGAICCLVSSNTIVCTKHG